MELLFFIFFASVLSAILGIWCGIKFQKTIYGWESFGVAVLLSGILLHLFFKKKFKKKKKLELQKLNEWKKKHNLAS